MSSTGRPRPRSEAAVEGQADPASVSRACRGRSAWLGGSTTTLSNILGKPLAIWELQNRCAGLPSCQLAACSLVQAREPAASIIVIDIPAGLDCTDAINDLPGLIEFERQLGQAVEIAVWIRAHHERNLRFGEPDFSRRFHRTNETDQGRLLDFMLLGRFAPMQDLLLYAKHLCVEATVQKTATVRQRRSGDGRRARPRWRHSRRAGEGIVLRLGGPLSGKPDIQPTSPNDRS